VHVPTLVVYRSEGEAEALEAAELIPRARVVRVAGEDHAGIFLSPEIVDELERFVAGYEPVEDRLAGADRTGGAVEGREESVDALGLPARIGVHVGECEVHEKKVSGIAVNVGARIASAAGAGEVLVSGTVRDLVAGSDLTFDDRGERELNGVPGTWRLFAAERSGARA
jgi:adenylate/guanylate cyclase family protein